MSRWGGSEGMGGETSGLGARTTRTLRRCSLDARKGGHRSHRPVVCVEVMKENGMGSG